MAFLKTLFGGNPLKDIERIADRVEALAPAMESLTDEQLREKTNEFRARLQKGETTDDLLPEAFAVVREASARAIGLRHYRVQLMGGVVLHQGRIAEMRTGEGKTLVATLPAYLNALEGKGVHIVTVNDYLARRDSEWMGKVYRFLGMTVGLIEHDMPTEVRRQSYAADITYGTNNEFGFDYLRDNMVIRKADMVQRGQHYAVVDEVDSILIDEARTPLIISGKGEQSTELYAHADQFVCRLTDNEDYTVDEKMKTAVLTEQGIKKAESFFRIQNLSDAEHTTLNHHINQALKAHSLFRRDVDYVVQDGEVVIVDEFTGRLMTGRRYSEGLHQAIEAKEKVKVAHESKTLATITFQNYFRMYQKLAGMTGTAKTEEEEFMNIYGLDVVEIPTNRPMIRQDHNDVVFGSREGKLRAVVEDIAEHHKQGIPVLVGTVSVERSEELSALLGKKGIKHNVLNAKNHRKEAEIIAQAGRLGAVTIATNMAGRGTDILLGGNPEYLARRQMRQDGYEDAQIENAISHADTAEEEVLAARQVYRQHYERFAAECDKEHARVIEVGGLHIIGTERHESRRIDNQLRGRAGRQGDPGSSRFYVAMEDDLMRLFGGERLQMLLQRLNPDDAMAMDAKMLSKQIESAQKRIEGRNFDMRKHVLQYDDVMNMQREVIYSQRRKVLMDEDVHANIMEMLENMAGQAVAAYCADKEDPDVWDLEGLQEYWARITGDKDFRAIPDQSSKYKLRHADLQQRMLEAAQERYTRREEEISQAGIDMREIERVLLLRSVDRHWMDHIDAMDQLRKGIGLRAYGQQSPIVAYRNEGSDMYDEMIASIQEETVRGLMTMHITSQLERKQLVRETAAPSKEAQTAGSGEKKPAKAEQKVGRNAPCPCGSGKKYKNCCGANQ